MYWWWTVYCRNPLYVFVGSIGLLMTLFLWAELPSLFGDTVKYNDYVLMRYEAGALFFPFTISYLLMATPYFLFEQRRQINRLLRHVNASRKLQHAYDDRLLSFSRRRSLIFLVFAVAQTVIYMLVEDILFIEGLTIAEEIRRSSYWTMPVLLWWFLLEGIGVMYRVTSLLQRIMQKEMVGARISRNAYRPFVRVFINNGIFVAFTAMAMPILLFGNERPWLDLGLFAGLVTFISLFLSAPIRDLHRYVKKGRLELVPLMSRTEGQWVSEREEAFDDAPMTRGFGAILGLALPGDQLAPKRAVFVLMLRFWLIMVLPVLLWGLVALVGHALDDSGLVSIL